MGAEAVVKLTPQEAVIYLMVMTSASDGVISEGELRTIGRVVRSFPLFSENDEEMPVQTAEDCGRLMSSDGGLHKVLSAAEAAMPEHLAETAYAAVVDVVTADENLDVAEIRVLELIRSTLKISDDGAQAIEHDGDHLRIVPGQRLAAVDDRRVDTEAIVGLGERQPLTIGTVDDEMGGFAAEIVGTGSGQVVDAVEPGDVGGDRHGAGGQHIATGANGKIAGGKRIAIDEARRRRNDRDTERGQPFGGHIGRNCCPDRRDMIAPLGEIHLNRATAHAHDRGPAEDGINLRGGGKSAGGNRAPGEICPAKCAFFDQNDGCAGG